MHDNLQNRFQVQPIQICPSSQQIIPAKTMTRRFLKEAIFEQQESGSNHQAPLLARDYITLKSRANPVSKSDKEESLLEYYTTEKYNEYLRTLTPIHEVYSPAEQKELDEMYDLASKGSNICVFGLGSKIQLLRRIHKKLFSEYHVFEIKGYLPSVSEKKIYNHFGGFLIDVGLTDKVDEITIKNQAQEYLRVLEDHGDVRVVVIFHSIDGTNLLNPESQEKLAELFKIPQIQLICSLDSMKMVMNWSPITLQKYRFHFFNINTRQPYIEEFKHRPLKKDNDETTEDALKCIWQSLNKNQKQIIKFIVKNELKNFGADQQQAVHYTFNELLQVCIDEIVLNSDHQLRQNLLELLDHKVIIERYDEKKNRRMYMMKYEKRILENILDYKIQ